MIYIFNGAAGSIARPDIEASHFAEIIYCRNRAFSYQVIVILLYSNLKDVSTTATIGGSMEEMEKLGFEGLGQKEQQSIDTTLVACRPP